jgi:hypothetical protein
MQVYWRAREQSCIWFQTGDHAQEPHLYPSLCKPADQIWPPLKTIRALDFDESQHSILVDKHDMSPLWEECCEDFPPKILSRFLQGRQRVWRVRVAVKHVRVAVKHSKWVVCTLTPIRMLLQVFLLVHTRKYMYSYIHMRSLSHTYTYIQWFTHIHTFAYSHICTYIRSLRHTHAFTDLHIHIHSITYTYAYIHLLSHTHGIHLPSHTHTFTYSYTHMHSITHTYTYIRLLTYTCAFSLSHTDIFTYTHTHIHSLTHYIHFLHTHAFTDSHIRIHWQDFWCIGKQSDSERSTYRMSIKEKWI